MKLYYSRGACSLAPHMLINELNLPCTFETVDLKTKLTETQRDFLTINPKGTVPVIETDSGEILTENAVILQYLADTHSATNLLPAINHFERYRVLEWLNYVATELHKGFGPLFNGDIPQEVKDNIFIPLLKKKFTYVNQQMKSTYLLGDSPTLPDIYLSVTLFWLRHFKIELDQWPNLNRFFSTFVQRPAIAKTFNEEGLKL